MRHIKVLLRTDYVYIASSFLINDVLKRHIVYIRPLFHSLRKVRVFLEHKLSKKLCCPAPLLSIFPGSCQDYHIPVISKLLEEPDWYGISNATIHQPLIANLHNLRHKGHRSRSPEVLDILIEACCALMIHSLACARISTYRIKLHRIFLKCLGVKNIKFKWQCLVAELYSKEIPFCKKIVPGSILTPAAVFFVIPDSSANLS